MKKFISGLTLSLLLFSLTATSQVTGLRPTLTVPVFNETTGKYAVLAKKRNLISGTKWYWVTASSTGQILEDSFRYGPQFSDSSLAASTLPAGFSVINVCDLPASWAAPTVELVGEQTRFTIRVSSSNNQTIQFKKGSAGTWQDATIGTNSIAYYGPSNGECQDFYYRVKGCSNEIFGCYLAYNVTTPPPSGSTSEIVAYTLETQQNRFNINQFPNVSLSANHKAIMGYGSPVFLGWTSHSPIQLFSKGFSHTSNASAFTRQQAPDSTQHWFLGASDLIRDEAAGLVSSYPDAANVASENWGAVSTPTRIQIGKAVYNNRASAGYDWQSGDWTRGTAKMFYHMDEEQFSGDPRDFLADVLTGFRSENSTAIINLYGQVSNYFYLGGSPYQYPFDLTDGQIISFRDQHTFQHSGYKDAGIAVDVSGGYFRAPVIKSTIYEKSGDDYVLDGFGKRKLRQDSFTETIFGRTFRILAQPDFRLVPGTYPEPTEYKTDVQWMLQELYLFADYLNYNAVGFAKTEFGDYNTTRWRPYGKKSSITFRPRTEPWTYGGNEYRIREVGEYGILYQVLYALFSGVNYIESWDNGWGGSYNGLNHATHEKHQIKNEGERLYPTPGYDWDNPKDYWNFIPNNQYSELATGDDNYSRYVVYTAAVQTFAKVCAQNNFTFDTTLRYIRFNTPVKTFQNKEVLATGIYQNGKFSAVFMYPYNDEGDILPITIDFGGHTINFNLQGRSPAVFTWSVPTGIDPSDVIIEYNNIDGNHRKMNGIVTGDPADHYVD